MCRLASLLIEYSLSTLPYQQKTVETPTGKAYRGVDFNIKVSPSSLYFCLLSSSFSLFPFFLPLSHLFFANYKKLCAVSVLRAGTVLESPIRSICKGIRIGKILIQSDASKRPRVFIFSSFPSLPPLAPLFHFCLFISFSSPLLFLFSFFFCFLLILY